MNLRTVSLSALLCSLLALTGCGLSGVSTTTPGSSLPGASPARTSVLGGQVHGGQSVISGATMTLWAAGAPTTGGGYGSGATSLATATSSSTGQFSFDITDAITDYTITSNIVTFTAANSLTPGDLVTLSGFSTSTFFNGQLVAVLSTGLSSTQFEAVFTYADTPTTTESGTVNTTNSPCTIGQYLYITTTGGNTGAGTNSYEALLAAIPTPCNSNTGSTSLIINEVTTIATVWSLQQFMTITPGGSPAWQIGAPSTNLTGLANAFTQVSQLANYVYGQSVSSTVSSVYNSTTYTTTIAPDTPRIYALADILASCVNSTDNAGPAPSTTCASLFTDTTPSSFTAPADTIQVAYYLATNPAMLTMPTHTPTAPSHLCSTYVLPTPPFATTQACSTTTDWVLGVSWRTVTGATTIGTTTAASVAVDANGNIWTGGGSGITSNIVNQFTPSGKLNMAPISTATIGAYTFSFDAAGTTSSVAYAGSSATLGYARPFGLAIDTSGNAWFASYGATSPGTLTLSPGSVSVPTGLLVKVSPSGTATGYLTGSSDGAIAIDGNNNIYLGDIPTTGKYYFSEMPAGGSYQTLNEGVGRGSNIFNGIFIDESANQYAWGMNSSTSCSPYTINRINTAGMAAGSSTQNVNNTSGCAYAGAADAAGNAWVTGGGNLYYLNISSSLTAPIVTTVTGSTNSATTGASGTAGLDDTSGVAIDGAGNVWVANHLSSSTIGGLSELSVSTTGTTTTATALSPGGTGVFGFQLDGALAPNAPVIDSSGNVWIMTTGGSYLYHIVGAAAPVVAPLSLAISQGKIGVRP